MRDRITAKGIAPEKIAVIPPWSHDSEVRFDAAGREQFRKAHDLQDKFVVMYSGNHSPVHPLDTLMRAAERFKDDKSIAFCFVGGGSEFKRVRGWAERPGEVENQTSRAKASEVGLLEYGIDSTGQAISQAKAGEVGLLEYGIDSTGQATSRAKVGERQGAGIGSTSPPSGLYAPRAGSQPSPQRGEGGLPSTLNAQPSTGKRPNILCLPYQPLNELAASLSAADAHVVVMGEAMLGLVHPCKIYNILAVGAPVIYIGPKPSHVTEILDRLGDEYPSRRVMHGEADLLAEQIQCLRQSGVASKRQLPVETLSAFSQALLLPRLAALIGGPGEEG
jgi:glycosyltransferase involved in cell wall biosynthesis